MKHTTSWLFLFLFALLLAGCRNRQNEIRPVILQGETQGTYFSITYFDTLNRDFSIQIDSIFNAVNKSLSVYDTSSLISRLNRNEDLAVDDLFARNFKAAQEVSEASDGAFDCTIGRLIEAWGFGFSKRDSVTPALVEKLKEQSGYRRVSLAGDRIVKEDPSITLNFNAIAQGFTSDVVAYFLQKQGVNDFLVDVGGELVSSGTKPGGVLWTIGIELPDESNQIPENLSDRPLKAVLTVTGKGIATSGNYRKFYVQDGVKYSHTIDPKTGYPVRHSLLSTTVVAADATTADAWATAFMVMGLEKSVKLLVLHPELEVYFIYADSIGTDRTWISDGLKGMIEEGVRSR